MEVLVSKRKTVLIRLYPCLLYTLASVIFRYRYVTMYLQSDKSTH